MNKKYKEWRKEILSFFNPQNKSAESERIYSPSQEFYLTISSFKTGEHTWAYSRGILRNSKTEKVIAEIKRNHPQFWYSWCLHRNGNEYLLCGEDYQGQTVINLTQAKVKNHFPEEGFKGHGFCWVDAHPSADFEILAVEGCYWACPGEIVFFEFSHPDELPYKEITRVEDVLQAEGWDEQGNFIIEKEIEIRKSDGKPYKELRDEEQDILDQDSSLSDYKKIEVIISLQELKKMAKNQ